MRDRRPAFLIAVLVLLVPTTTGFVRTARALTEPAPALEDDGKRYVLTGSSRAPDVEPAWMVEAMQALRTVDWFGPSRASEDWNKWCEVAQKHGLRAEIVEASSLDHYARRPNIAAQVVRLVQEGRIEAMLLVEWDQLFVTLLDEDQRKILYRRRYFDEAWSGRIIELAAGSEPDRCRD